MEHPIYGIIRVSDTSVEALTVKIFVKINV